MRELLDEMLDVLKELQAINDSLIAERDALHREIDEATRVLAQMRSVRTKVMFDTAQRDLEARLQ
jgi:hypothetical protein